MAEAIQNLLQGPVRVVNVGLAGFARDLAANGEAVAHVDWTPPAGGRPKLLAALAEVDSSWVEAANGAALEQILAADPVLADVGHAGELIPELDRRRLVLHAIKIERRAHHSSQTTAERTKRSRARPSALAEAPSCSRLMPFGGMLVPSAVSTRAPSTSINVVE